MIKANCTFHGVGQGLFYSASISDENGNRFNFIYDCGTYYGENKTLLSNQIKAFCKDKKVIDALFISHFHKDHISGIPELMKQCKIKRVFLPYFTDEEFILLRNNYEGSLNNELERFYSQPIDYFDGEVEYIFIVGSNPDENDNSYNSYINKRDDFDNDWSPLESDLEEDDGLRIDFNRRTSRIKKGKKKTSIISCSEIGIRNYQLNWHFKVYQDQNKREQKRIVEIVKKRYQSTFDEEFSNDCTDIFTDPNKVHFLKDTYALVKHGINQSSLVLCHYPEEHLRLNISNALNKYIHNYYHSYFDCCCALFCNHYALCANTATLLTGDINFNYLSNNKENFKKYIKQITRSIGILQLPHHGSQHNCSYKTIDELNLLNTFMICSYGLRNHFKHPDSYLLYQLNGSCNHIFHVNEYESFSYEIC